MMKTSYRYMKLRKSIDTTTTRTGKCLEVIDLVEYGMFGGDFHQQPKPKFTQSSVCRRHGSFRPTGRFDPNK